MARPGAYASTITLGGVPRGALTFLLSRTRSITGKLVLDPTLALMTTGVLFVLDIIVIVLAVRLFDRETILTRWR